MSRFAGGNYMTIMHFYNKFDENIVTISFNFEFVTTDREAFK